MTVMLSKHAAVALYTVRVEPHHRRFLISVAVWCSGSVFVSINEVNLHRARLVLGWVTVSGSIPGARHLTQYVTSHPGQLSLPSLRGR